MDPKKLVDNLVQNAWEWGLVEFSEKAGLDSESEDARNLFKHFQEGARHLGYLNDNLIRIVMSTPKTTASAYK